MNSAQLKFFQMFADFARSDIEDAKSLEKSVKGFLALDYPRAVDVWEYLTATYEAELADPAKALLYGDSIYKIFKSKAASKVSKTIMDVPSVRRAVFQYCPNIGEGDYFNMLVDLLVMNKVAAADEILKCVSKNTNNVMGYGPYMKAVLERLFIEILKRSDTKRIEMSRKLSALLLGYISKIKTDERAMLEQRIRELN